MGWFGSLDLVGLTESAAALMLPDPPRLSAKPPSEQPKAYTDGESYRGGHGIWKPIALHVPFRTSRGRTEKGRAGPLLGGGCPARELRLGDLSGGAQLANKLTAVEARCEAEQT
jgi:hypothetical protein